MTVGKMTAACWVLFGVMCFAFMPLLLGVYSIPGLPGPARLVAAVFVVAVLWWGPFVYGMYLAQAVMGNGDRRLLKRGVRGTAVVLKAEVTGMSVGGAPDMGRLGRQIYRYHLRVSIPGKAPYETYCSSATHGIAEGQRVPVAVGRHNRKRVTIDVGQGTGKGYAPRTPVRHLEDDGPRTRRRPGAETDNAARIRQLTDLGRLHSQGVLTDAEFAAEKARVLDQ
jgi:hypothetical protein